MVLAKIVNAAVEIPRPLFQKVDFLFQLGNAPFEGVDSAENKVFSSQGNRFLFKRFFPHQFFSNRPSL